MPQPPRENPFRNWLPPTSMTAIRQEVSDLVENLFGDSLSQFRGESGPRIDVVETPDAVEVTTDLPGFRRDEIQVEVDDKSLTISGTRSEEASTVDETRKYHRLERRMGNFSRTIWLPCPVDEQKIDARLTSGVLKIRLPKLEPSRRRKVEVHGEDLSAPPL
ncbi:Hsp20/alpha crystallin family protein [Planctomicrobium sp. SH661]|uniref:Hsp20/alpha crystallin family protein n=1 Tax=Planctomicrobium sp. SH661 TaxID=3448124 RepID=UPI003F5C1DFF